MALRPGLRLRFAEELVGVGEAGVAGLAGGGDGGGGVGRGVGQVGNGLVVMGFAERVVAGEGGVEPADGLGAALGGEVDAAERGHALLAGVEGLGELVGSRY